MAVVRGSVWRLSRGDHNRSWGACVGLVPRLPRRQLDQRRFELQFGEPLWELLGLSRQLPGLSPCPRLVFDHVNYRAGVASLGRNAPESGTPFCVWLALSRCGRGFPPDAGIPASTPFDPQRGTRAGWSQADDGAVGKTARIRTKTGRTEGSEGESRERGRGRSFGKKRAEAERARGLV